MAGAAGEVVTLSEITIGTRVAWLDDGEIIFGTVRAIISHGPLAGHVSVDNGAPKDDDTMTNGFTISAAIAPGKLTAVPS